MGDINKNNWTLELAKKSLRQQFGATLKDLGTKNKAIVVLDGDLSSSTQTKIFGAAFPERFFNVGIAEQNMVGIANGLASSGKIAIASGFTSFTVGRGWEFIRLAAHDQLNVKICTTHAGLSNSRDGSSHQTVEDLALMLTIPGTRVYCPCDPLEIDPMLSEMIAEPGVCFLRMMRDPMPWVWNTAKFLKSPFIEMLYESSPDTVDVTIFSTGSMSCYNPKIAQLLEQKEIKARSVHLGRIKPLSEKSLELYLERTRVIITLEEHNIICGFGAMLCRIIAKLHPKPTLALGIQDRFGQSGKVEELYQEYGLTPEQIAQQILDFLPKKESKKKKTTTKND